MVSETSVPDSGWRRVAVAAIALGAIVRLAVWFHDRSFWMDETLLVLNVSSRSLGELLGTPLSLQQAAPPLFLVIAWLSSRLPLDPHLSIRALGLIAGCAIPALTYLVARRLSSSQRAAALTTLAVALSPPLIRFSVEFKPYIVDAAVVLGLGLVALQWFDRPDRRSELRLAAAGAIAILISFAGVLALAPIGLALLVASLRSRESRRVARTVAVGLGWLVVFVAVYQISYRAGSGDTALRRFWEGSFLSLDPGQWYRLVWYWLFETFGNETPFEKVPGIGAFLVVGFLGITITTLVVLRWRGLLVLVGPIATAALASLLGQLPFSVRLLTFAIPLLYLMAALAIVAAVRRLPRPVGAVTSGVAVAGVVAYSLAILVPGLHRLAPSDDLGRLVTDAELKRHPTEPVYVFARALPIWAYYADPGRNPERLRALITVAGRIGPNSGNNPPRGHPVANEGEELRLEDLGRTLLIGVPSGSENRFANRWLGGPSVDSGWGVNEASRIGRAGTDCVWAAFTHNKQYELNAFDEALLASGFGVSYRVGADGAELRRYCRPGSAAIPNRQ